MKYKIDDIYDNDIYNDPDMIQSATISQPIILQNTNSERRIGPSTGLKHLHYSTSTSPYVL